MWARPAKTGGSPKIPYYDSIFKRLSWLASGKSIVDRICGSPLSSNRRNWELTNRYRGQGGPKIGNFLAVRPQAWPPGVGVGKTYQDHRFAHDFIHTFHFLAFVWASAVESLL